jgi:formate-dependent nitrite reductase membrane component NrfD
MGSDATTEGLRGERPGREATTGVIAGRARTDGDGDGQGPPTVAEVGAAVPAPGEPRRRRGGRGGRGEERMVPDARPTSYYGQPVINAPVWHEPDIPGYLFLGGLAGASSVIAAGAQLTGRSQLARVAKVGSAATIGVSLAALVHDLGRPARFLNMLRVFKPTSPMSVGSWLLTGFAPASMAAAATAITGRLPRLGAAATAGAAALGPAVAAYTSALIADTAVPAWHDGWRELPFVFVSSGASAAAGLALAVAPPAETHPVRRLAVVATIAELAATRRMEHRLGTVAHVYHEGPAGRLMTTAEVLAGAGAAAALGGTRHPWIGRIGGAALVASSACTRFGIFRAGLASARDPADTIAAQRARVEARDTGVGDLH